MANALEIGVDAAYKAVMKPAEGTILTVARVSAEKARESSFITNDPLVQWSDVCAAARDALDKTPEQLPILKKPALLTQAERVSLSSLKRCSVPLRASQEPL